MAQGALPFQYEAETRGDGARRIYLDLIKGWMSRSRSMSGEQGWLDLQMIVALIVLNLAGGWRIWSGWSRTPALSR
jgi:hypothetical protein